jgi:hypothetical protein
MNSLDSYRDSFPNARLTRSESGVLEVALHTDGGTLVFNGHPRAIRRSLSRDRLRSRQSRGDPDRQR